MAGGWRRFRRFIRRTKVAWPQQTDPGRKIWAETRCCTQVDLAAPFFCPDRCGAGSVLRSVSSPIPRCKRRGNMIRYLIYSVAVSALLGSCAFADNWPAWRGADGLGHCRETGLPLKWSPTENIRWKVALPDEGNSTPAIWGERIFITQATDKGRVRA